MLKGIRLVSSTWQNVLNRLACKCWSWMGDYRYHELCPLINYFLCHWVVPVDFPNTCPMKIVRIFYRIIARYGRDIYTSTQYFNLWCSRKIIVICHFIDDILNLRKGIRMCPNFGWSLTWSILARLKPF